MASFPDNPQLRLHYMGKAGPNEFLLRLAKDAGAGLPAEFSSELGLTTREGEVLAWLSKGKTNRDIAQILGLSPRTVDKHLEQIYAKLGVENRTAAAAIAANSPTAVQIAKQLANADGGNGLNVVMESLGSAAAAGTEAVHAPPETAFQRAARRETGQASG